MPEGHRSDLVPPMKVAEYHRPYVAVFVEGAGGKHAANLAELQRREAARSGAEP